MPSKLKNLVICFSGSFEESGVTLRKWVEANGATYDKQLSSATTHLVVSKANWRARVPEVKAALKDKSIKIVEYEWFDDKLRLGGRIHDTKYLWTTIDEKALEQEAKNAKAAEREKKRIAKEKERKKKESERIDYGAALLQHTNVVARADDGDDDEDSDDSSPGHELAQKFAKGAKQAKEDLMSDNHHVYMDETSFLYDIVLTKASVELARMERARITIYESNAGPHDYAVVVEVADKRSLDHKLTTINHVSFPTAFRIFRENFHSLTNTNWNDRVKVFSEHASLQPQPRPVIQALKTSRAKSRSKNPQSEEPTPEELQRRLEAHFETQKYRYRLPADGAPRGTFRDGSHYVHQDKKSVYDLFGKECDRGHEVLAKKEKVKEEIARLKKLALKRQNKAVEVVVIESDDEDEESDEEEESDDEMEGDEGYVAVKAADVEMEGAAVEGPGVEEDFTMVDAPATLT